MIEQPPCKRQVKSLSLLFSSKIFSETVLFCLTRFCFCVIITINRR
nr:MAG TPA: hypothetical protein [Caudoviricetes sp.]